MGRMTRLGILGGTFDPPHIAHLIMAETARAQFDLDKVLWVVAGDPPHKKRQQLAPVKDRIAMVRLAIEDNKTFELSFVDVDRPGPHYSVDMLGLIAQAFPEAGLFFILGSDALRDLPSWHRPADLIKRAYLVVVPRHDASFDIHAIEQVIPEISSKLLIANSPHCHISARDIRSRVASEQTIHYQVTDSVESYIRDTGLYRVSGY